MFGNNNNKSYGFTTQETIHEKIRNEVIAHHTLNVINAFDKYKMDHSDEKFIDDCGNNLLHLATKFNNLNLTKYLLDNNVSKYEKNIFDETAFSIAMKNGNTEIVKMFCGTDQLEMYIKKNKILENKIDEMGDKYTNMITINDKLKKESVALTKHFDNLTDKFDEMRAENTNFKMENNVLRKNAENDKKRYTSKVTDCMAAENDYKRMKIERDNLLDDLKKFDGERKTLKRKADESIELSNNFKKLKDEKNILINENNELRIINKNLMDTMRK